MCIWSQVLSQFEAHLKQSGLAQSTVSGYMSDVQSFSLWLAEYAGQEVSPAAFSSSDMEAYKQYLRGTLGRLPAGINRRLQSLRKFGRFAVTAGIRDSNPAQGVRLLEGQGRSTPRTLTELQIQRLIEVAKARRSRNAARDCAILQLLLRTGIRVAELVELRLTDIDLREDYAVLTIHGQRRRPERRLPLNEAERRALCAYLGQSRPLGASHVFLSREGKPLSIRSVQKIVADLGKTAGLDISARTLRDTYARSLWRDTGDVSLLTERLGHRKVETALRHILLPAHSGVINAGS